ncbi:hypothetical protein LZ198_26930 [Myxococcus sp. K15C18031901]|uniref:hypothetical protein n=1 Tax=Myxococcus dinghuensis TaxID=2906761 RepID=UPI0020A7FE3B|nr:hypothetical protein [Myxococcus dinghuensis]MCP3102513.1 hypothetical protein [Myxococcus dinghuensis]
MRLSLLPVLALASSCVHHAGARSEPPQEDLSVTFPAALGEQGTPLPAQGQPAVMDGETLRALSVAADDFLPPDARGRSCWNRQESYRYRVLREGDVSFVGIAADPAACGAEPRMLDGGARYAIGRDGRILRRLFDGEPDAATPASDAGTVEPSSDASSLPVGDTTWGEPVSPVPSWWRDGGTDAGPAPR